MDKLTLDFETYFDADITLKKLNYTEYAAKTHVMCCSISLNDDEPIYLINDSIKSTLNAINWSNTELICHNALFDALILKQHYGIEAARYSDTLAASRLLHHTWKHDLANLATALGLDGESKQHTALTSVKGMTWDALTVPQQQTLVNYNLNDVRLTRAIYDVLWPQVPQIERDIINHTIKLFLRPTLVLDSTMAQLALDEERLETEQLITESGLSKTDIRSDAKFSAHLSSLGYEIPVKWSAKKNCNVPAFAKSDPSDFYDENPEIQPLLDLKRRINSNIKESRTERLLSSCAVHNDKIPVAYNYCGAFTGRFSGSNNLNLQNLPRGSILRSCITAPPGQTLVVCDLSQVEARLTAWFCKEEKLLTSFRERRDIYCDVASEIFNKPINKKDHPHERFCGKCLSADTKVLTDSGWKSIIKVTITDLLWDGVSWVSHKGLSLSGNLKTLTGYGVTATSQHLMLTLDGWRKWEDILTNPSLFQSALKSANLPSSIGYDTSNPQVDQADGIQLYIAPVGGKDVLTELTSKRDAPLAATTVRKSQALQNAIGHIKTLCQMTNTALAYLTDSLPVLDAATPLPTNTINPTEVEAYQFSQNGVRTNRHSSNMYKQSKAGIFQHFRWIASITKAITNLVTSVSLLAESTASTIEKQTIYLKKSLPLPKRMPVYDLLSAGPNNRFTIWSDEGPIIAHNSAVLGLGYGMGAERFQTWCKQSGATLELDFCQNIVKKYREKFSEISSTWKALNLNIYKLKTTQKISPFSSSIAYTEPSWLGVKKLPITMTPNKIHLPSGRVLNYGNVITGEHGGLRIENGRYIHGAVILENCIAKGTLVLTEKGWQPIESITHSDKIHDGVEFVNHGGLIFKSVQPCVIIDGVAMTPDHEVLTDDGWTPAQQNPRPYRPDIRAFNSHTPSVLQWVKDVLAISMPMWKSNSKTRSIRNKRSKSRLSTTLWMLFSSRKEKQNTRNVSTSSLCSMEKYDGSLSFTNTPSIRKLWRTWNNSLRTLANRFSTFLGRHGTDLSKRANFGTDRQRCWIFPRELQMGYLYRAGSQQVELPSDRHTYAIETNRDLKINPILSDSARNPDRQTNNPTQTNQPVYDIVNCGPRQRFVVKGHNGPFVVHNCIQALSRDILVEQILIAEQHYPVVMHTHDEIVWSVPSNEAPAAKEKLLSIMRTPPDWCKDIPLDAEAGTGQRFNEAK